MLKKIIIKNYRTFRNFELDFDPEMNILVGDNDAGKSTLLEAMSLALTCRLRGRLLTQDLSPYLFNAEAVADYIKGLRNSERPAPPEIIIDLFLESCDETARLRGSENSLKENEPGIRVRVAFNEDYEAEYRQFIQVPAQRLVPVEYYRVDWLDFAGNHITALSVPATASLIDASNIHLQNGADYYLNGIINSQLSTAERVELARVYRTLREDFIADPAIDRINKNLSEAQRGVSDRNLTLNIDVSQRSNWESNLIPHLDDLPFHYVGKGEQSTLKILLALNNEKAERAPIILVEEPENHLSFPNLGKLVKKIADKCGGRQVFITTHSSYVLNKLGLEHLVLLTPSGGFRLSNLGADTYEFFRKLAGYDTLRIVLARRSILVEGPSDDLVIQRAYRDVHENRIPSEDGVDVISAKGLTFKRFLDIARLLPQNQVRVVTDNDGKDVGVVRAARFGDYLGYPNLSFHVGIDKAYPSLEPQLLQANGRTAMNAILGKNYGSDEELVHYMTENKTVCALAILDSPLTVIMPEYIRDAVA